MAVSLDCYFGNYIESDQCVESLIVRRVLKYAYKDIALKACGWFTYLLIEKTVRRLLITLECIILFNDKDVLHVYFFSFPLCAKSC